MKLRPPILREALLQQSTPTILFDYESIEANLKLFRKITINAEATWSYAVKALAKKEVFEMAAVHADGFDISNLAEWDKIKDIIQPSHTIWLTNGNLEKELSTFQEIAKSRSLIVTVNDLRDYGLVKDANIPFVIRLGSSEFTKQAAKSRFGLTLDQLASIEDELQSNKLFRGFHTHQGIEDHHPALLHQILDGIKVKLSKWSGQGLIFNIGGSYQVFSEQQLESAVNSLRNLFKVHIEPGRAVVKDAGFALAQVEKIVEDGDTLRIFSRLSFLCHLKWSKPRFAGILNSSEAISTYTQKKIVLEGPTCFEYDKSDSISIDMPLSFAVGSLIILENITGYSSEWNKGFNGIEECRVKFVGRRRPDSP